MQSELRVGHEQSLLFWQKYFLSIYFYRWKMKVRECLQICILRFVNLWKIHLDLWHFLDCFAEFFLSSRGFIKRLSSDIDTGGRLKHGGAQNVVCHDTGRSAGNVDTNVTQHSGLQQTAWPPQPA